MPGSSAQKISPKARCLVVDDDEDLRWVVMRALMRADFHCEAARDGEHALQLMSQSEFQIVVTDLRMPKKHGFNLASEIMKLPNTKPAIIVYTGIEEPKLIAQMLAMGVDDVCIKPMNPDILAAKVLAVFGRWSDRQAKQGKPAKETDGARVEPRFVVKPDPKATESSSRGAKVDRKVVKLAQ